MGNWMASHEIVGVPAPPDLSRSTRQPSSRRCNSNTINWHRYCNNNRPHSAVTIDAMEISIDALSTLDKYPAKQHAARVARALGVKEGLIYLCGEFPILVEDSDMPQPLRQRRYFYYLSGCDEHSCHVTYDIAREQLTLWLRPFTTYDVIWLGRGSTKEEAESKYDIDVAEYSDKLDGYLKNWSKVHDAQPIYVLHDRPGHYPPKRHCEQHFDSSRLLPAIDECRVIKDAHEVNLIQRANDISSEAHTNVLRYIRRFTSEQQVAAMFLYTSIAEGAPEQAYTPIAGSGPNSAVLHYMANNESFGDRQSMVLDAGCSYSLYASDITRSFPLNGHWSREGQEVYNIVADMQFSAMNIIGPGKHMLAAHALCHVKAVRGLMKLGVLIGDSEKEVLESGISAAFYPHGLGHHVGLEVHDVSSDSFRSKRMEPMTVQRNSHLVRQAADGYCVDWLFSGDVASQALAPCRVGDDVLAPGMVITVEPGM